MVTIRPIVGWGGPISHAISARWENLPDGFQIDVTIDAPHALRPNGTIWLDVIVNEPTSGACAAVGSWCSAAVQVSLSTCEATETTPTASSPSNSEMTESRLSAVRVVLYEPQDPVNIAATVRAMKNMGVSALSLVRPVPYDPYRLEGIAHGTQDLIERIQLHQTFDAAVADCVRVFAFTARRRAAKFRILEPKAAAAELLAASVDGPVAIVFGREDSGLPNDILDGVHAVVTIPTTDHTSINLAQSALIGLYELHLARWPTSAETAAVTKEPRRPHARHKDEFDLFFADAERSLAAIEFFKTRNVEHIMRSLRAMIFRADPDARELSLLRAMYIEVIRYLELSVRRP